MKKDRISSGFLVIGDNTKKDGDIELLPDGGYIKYISSCDMIAAMILLGIEKKGKNERLLFSN